MMAATLEVSRYGTPAPTYRLAGHPWKASHFRHTAAALLTAAARIEAATLADDARNAWVVVVDRDRECITLELADGSPDEVERAMAVLRSLDA